MGGSSVTSPQDGSGSAREDTAAPVGDFATNGSEDGQESREFDVGGLDSGLRAGRGSIVAIIAAVVAVVLGALMSVVHLPYAIFTPGPISNTLGQTADGKPVISVKGAPTYPTQGQLDFTTVIILGGPGNEVTGWELLRAWLDPTREIYDKELVFPSGVTDKQVEEQNAAEMTGSQQEAIAVALRSLGKKVDEHVIIAGVADSAPSADLLAKDDEIVKVDGTAVTTSADLVSAIEAHKPGDTVHLVVLRDGQRVPVDATTTKSGGRTVLGVFLRLTFDFPFDVSIDAGNVGGPSAGMMFSLAVRDVLTPGAMTRGARIAGTGTIGDDGAIGPISGIPQKMVGADDGGATWFLAPSANCDEVVGHVPDGLHVVRVGTYDDAVRSVEAIADGSGDTLPTCTSGTSSSG